MAVGLTRTLEILRAELASCSTATFKVVISGDLTATGAREEFANAQSFIGSKWLTCFDRPSIAGLSLEEAHAVPGNHDYWGGLTDLVSKGGFFPHGLSILAPPQFRPTPWQESWASPDGSLRLELFGIDTNSGVTGRNPLANGKISNQELDELEAMLAKSVSGPESGKRVRAVMLHHSPSNQDSSNALDPESTRRLLELCKAFQISALLSGDVHTFASKALAPRPHAVYELRSPTTMQGPADRAEAGFLVHRVSLRPQEMPRWQTYLYNWASPGPSFTLNGGKNGDAVSDFRCG